MAKVPEKVFDTLPLLLDPDSDQHLARNLQAVGPFELFELLRDFCPSPFLISLVQLGHQLLKITRSFSHASNSRGCGGKPARYRRSMDGYVLKTGLGVESFKHSRSAECEHPRFARRRPGQFSQAANGFLKN